MTFGTLHNLNRTHSAIVSWGGQKKGPERSRGKEGERTRSRHMGLIANQVVPAPALCELPCASPPPSGTPPSHPMQAACIQARCSNPRSPPSLGNSPFSPLLESSIHHSGLFIRSFCWSVSLLPTHPVLLLHKMFPEGKDCVRNLLFPKPFRALVLRKHLLEKVRVKTPRVKCRSVRDPSWLETIFLCPIESMSVTLNTSSMTTATEGGRSE